MTKGVEKRGRGRPKKVDAYNISEIVGRIQEEQQKFSAKCADNMEALFQNIYDVAFDGDSPRKDRVAATKYCIEFADAFLEDKLSPDGKGKEFKKDGKTKAPLISLKAVD